MRDLADLIEDYKTPKLAMELIRSTRVVLLSGITSAGKDTIKKEIIKSDNFRDIVSHTTRQPRSNSGILETPGVDYHFIDDAAAQDMLEREQFIEAKFVHGTVYGTSVGELMSIHDSGQTAITDLDVQGVAEYKNISSEVITIFILPPSYQVWPERLEARYGESNLSGADWTKRRESAIKELKQALLVPYYHFVINDELERAVDATRQIVSHSSDEFHSRDDEERLLARQLLSVIEQNS